MKITGYEFRVYRRPPRFGEHTEEVFAEWLGAAAQPRRAMADVIGWRFAKK